MEVLILGDSYGVPNWLGPPCPGPEASIEYQLRADGHIVHNVSVNGMSNRYILNACEQYLSGQAVPYSNNVQHNPLAPRTIKADNTDFAIQLIIWFQAPLYRDVQPGATVESQLAVIANNTYSRVKMLRDKLNCPIAVIGGASPVLPIIYEHFQPDFIVEDWKSEILGKKISQAQTMGGFPSAELLNSDTMSFVDNLLAEHDRLILDLDSSERFPDRWHTDAAAYNDLYYRIKKQFKL